VQQDDFPDQEYQAGPFKQRKGVSFTPAYIPGVSFLDFGRSVNPISTRGTDYAHLITTGTPGFSDLPTSLLLQVKDNFKQEQVEKK
jgi:hypothetical protein